MPSTTAFTPSVAAAMLAANQKLNTDFEALQQNPTNQSLIATVQQDVVAYYDAQLSQRGYASLAAAVAGQSDYNGYVAIQNIENSYGDSSYGINEVTVAARLAQQDFSNITDGGLINVATGGTIYVPTIVDDDQEHQQVFGDLGLNISYWSGTSLAAYNVNWMGSIATPAELQGVSAQSSLFSNLSQGQVCESFADLAESVMQTNIQTNTFQNGLLLNSSTIPECPSENLSSH